MNVPLLRAIHGEDFLSRRSPSKRWTLLNKSEIDTIMRNAGAQPIPPVKSTKSLFKKRPLLAHILMQFPNELFFAGGSLFASVKRSGIQRRLIIESFVKDFDLFVCAENEARANYIVGTCIEYLEASPKPESVTALIQRSKRVITVNLPDYSPIQFILRLYEHPSQIIGQFDLPPCQFMYSHGAGLQATLSGAFSLATNSLWLDPTRRSLSYQNRVQKYNGYGLNAFCPCTSIPNDAPAFCIDGLTITPWSSQWQQVIRSNPHAHRGDYEEEFSNSRKFGKMTYILSSKRYDIYTLDYDSWQKMITSDPLVKMRSLDMTFPSERRRTLSPGKVKSFFANDSAGDVEKLSAAFKQAYFIEENFKLADELWSESLERRYKFLAEKCPWLQGLPQWQTVNPGSQASGSFDPVLTAGEYWNREFVQPIHVGLSHDIYLVLRQLWKAHVMPKCGGCLMKDLLNVLCYWVLCAQVQAFEFDKVILKKEDK